MAQGIKNFEEPRKIHRQACEVLAALYLDYVNNWLTVASFAEHNGLHKEEAEKLIKLGRIVANRPHPDA